MAVDKQTYGLIASYLSGNISNAEKIAVEKWIDESSENKTFFEEVQKIWQSSGVRLQHRDVDTTRLIHELQHGIDESQRPLGKVLSIIRPYKLYWRVAAGICLLVVSYFIFRGPAEKNIVVEAGDRVATVYLPDSTKVWLNIHSRITYPEKFLARAITLQGEAFLSVRKDSTNFTVTTEHTLTQVIGTAFNIKEQGDTAVTLTVVEGTVRFSDRDSALDKAITVKAQQQGIFKSHEKIKSRQNTDPSFAAWRKQNNPVFDHEKSNPTLFLNNTYSWRKNQINQSVIEGTFNNSATLAGFKKIKLEVTYTKPNGNHVTVELTVDDTVHPGQRLSYRKRLLDIFTDTRSVVVKIKSAEAD
jgi:ferric-dicitrate binding protein FerR (iron transport regulator)